MTEQLPLLGSGFPPGLGRPALRALRGAGYTCLEQLSGVPGAELLRLHGLGPKGVGLLRTALAAQGLSLADTQPRPEPRVMPGTLPAGNEAEP